MRPRSSATCRRSPGRSTDDLREKCCPFSVAFALATPFASLGSDCGDCCGARLPWIGLRAREPRLDLAEVPAAAADRPTRGRPALRPVGPGGAERDRGQEPV